MELSVCSRLCHLIEQSIRIRRPIWGCCNGRRLSDEAYSDDDDASWKVCICRPPAGIHFSSESDHAVAVTVGCAVVAQGVPACDSMACIKVFTELLYIVTVLL